MNADTLENWIMKHAENQRKIYFRINGDIPLESNEGETMFFELFLTGKRVLVLHPEHLTPVAKICLRNGVQMVQA